MVAGGLCFEQEFSKLYFVLCACLNQSGDFCEKIKEHRQLLKAYTQESADMQEMLLIAIELLVVSEKPTFIKKYESVLKTLWEWDVAQDVTIEAWVQNENALQRYCGHAWTLKVAIKIREEG